MIERTGIIRTICKLAWFFEKLAEYNTEQVEELSRNNPYPFKAWFGSNGRTYVPFNGEGKTKTSDTEKYLSMLLKEYGWEVSDYIGGYATQGARTVSIGKILQKIKKDTEKDTKSKLDALQASNTDKFEIDIAIRKAKEQMDFILETEKEFQTDPIRSKSTGLSIVFTQNPHDVALMSTGRSWTSCMNLDQGSHRKDVFCEIEKGGFVAYLINSDDLDIKKPHARIHIRRFTNSHGDNVAMPEETIYGNDTPGFLETVQKWVDSKQGTVRGGMYRRQGGSWSDSFDKTHFVSPTGVNLSDDIASLVKVLQSEEMEGAKYTEYRVIDNYSDWFDDPENDETDYEQTFFDKTEAEEYVRKLGWNDSIGYQQEAIEDSFREDLRYKIKEENRYEGKDKYEIEDLIEEEVDKLPPRFVIKEKAIDTMDRLHTEAANKLLAKPKGSLDSSVLQLLRGKAIENGKISLFGQEMAKKYPELFSPEEITQLGDISITHAIKNMPPEMAQKYKKEYIDRAIYALDNPTSLLPEDFSGPTPSVFGNREYIPDLSLNFIKKIKDPIREYADQLQEGVIQKLVNLPVALEVAGVPGDSKYIQQIKLDIMSIMFSKKADTPTVQKYFGDVLASCNENDKYHVFRCIAGLGENGTQFLPQLREELEIQKEKYKEQYEIKSKNKDKHPIDVFLKRISKKLESILFCIDAIESGTGQSKKYQFHW